VLQGTAEQVLARLPDGAVGRCHVYFPDPWPKARHRRRRFLRAGNIGELARVLRPGGELLIATDFLDYHLQAKLLCLLEPRLELSSARPPEDILVSVYGGIIAGNGRAIYHLAARRREASAGAGGAAAGGAGAGSPPPPR